jgi:serine/threonine protein kinase
MSQTALIVDDEAPMRALFRAFLEEEGIRVLEAEGGAEALEILQKETVNIIVSDMVMPGVTGLDLLSAVHEEYPNLPVVIVTGKPDVEVAVECMRVGALDYITKPCDFDHFRKVVLRGVGSEARTVEIRQTDVRDLRSVDGYAIKKVLGEGTMGIVFLAEKDGQKYALKIMKSLVLQPSEVKSRTARFIREIEVATQVQSEYIVKIVSHGVAFDEEIPYFAMEYVDGSSLVDHLSAPRAKEMPQRIQFIRQIAEALVALHGHGIVHRDLKPENILLDSQLTVKLGDFGIVQTPNSELTLASGLMGSPAFMAPEAFENPKVTQKADLFSLGVVAYKLLTGRYPFHGNTLYSLARSVSFNKPSLPSKYNPYIPDYLLRLLGDMFQKEVDDRIDSAKDILNALESDEYRPKNGDNSSVWEA